MHIPHTVFITWFFGALLVLIPAASAGDAEDAAVLRVREAWNTIEAQIQAGAMLTATLTLGGGQNPNEIQVHFQGGTEQDFMKDPYAAPFVVRRVVLQKVLPAVGPAKASFWFDEQGELIFVHTQGTDICHTGIDLAPADELRVYYQGISAVRVLWDSGRNKPTRKELPVLGDISILGVKAGLELRSCGQSLRLALEDLAR